ncbi:hypothetical protein F4678DRAFT_242591 [Xylaria arbuscula]|nr:hypothetical protein F4678DRAFT_242591 [Xylaria arbuscula]
MKPPSISSEQDRGPDIYPPHVRHASSMSSSGSTRKPSAKAIPQILSPTIEESPSPEINTLKPIHDFRKANEDSPGNFNQNAYDISSDTHPSQVHGSSSAGNSSRHEFITGEDTVISQPAPSIGTRTPESPLSSSPVQKNRTLIAPFLDVVPLDSGQARGITTSKANSSPGSRTDPSSSFLSSPQVTPQHGNGPVTPNHKDNQEAISCDYGTGSYSTKSNDEATRETDSDLAQAARETVVSGKTHPLDPQLRDSYHGNDPGNMRLSHSTTNPHLRIGGNQTGIESPDLGYLSSGNPHRTHLGSERLASPADQWRNLLASSKASTESLAKSAKERRLKRSAGHTAARPSREASALTDTVPATPEWKGQWTRKGYEPKEKSAMPRSERQSIREDTPQHTRPDLETRGNQFSPDKSSTNTYHKGVVQRSASKPMPGAVKAMAALFDSTAKKSPDTPSVTLNGRTRRTIRESESFPCRDVFDESPTKPKPHRGAIASTKRIDLDDHSRHRGQTAALTPEKRHPTPRSGISTIRTAPHRPMVEHTPTKSAYSTLKPVKTFSSARKEPQSLRNKPSHETDRNQPLRLGTMVPHEEEPPIGHFVRPSSAISTQSQTAGAEGVPALNDGPGSRQTSFLHAQIRSLQRQLALRDEEILQLRRQLETQEHRDIGTLSEQLRFAKRECMTWRKRAETAERRVAVFQRLGSGFAAFRDGAGDDDHGDLYYRVAPDGRDYMADDGASSSYSVHTESREAFNNRIRDSFAANARITGGEMAIFEDRAKDVGDGGAGGYQLCRGKSPRISKLWETTQNILDLQRRDDMYLLRREHVSF